MNRGIHCRHRHLVVFLGVSTLLAVLSPSFSANAREKKARVQASALPTHIRKAITDAFPTAKILSIEKEVEGEDPGQYDVDVLVGNVQYELEISPEGKLTETKEKEPADEGPSGGTQKEWTSSFGHSGCTFSSIGRNRFFTLEPGCRLVLESRSEKVVITVLNETRRIGNVETRVVEEREEKNGKLVEVSRNFFAECKEHGDVFYFGEEVDMYEGGKITRHSGAWRADEEDSSAGLMMPGTILLGARFYQEISPAAKDRAEILRDDVTMKTPAGNFKSCIRIEETSALDPDDKCYKTYAPGVGLIQDEDLLLTSYSRAE